MAYKGAREAEPSEVDGEAELMAGVEEATQAACTEGVTMELRREAEQREADGRARAFAKRTRRRTVFSMRTRAVG